MAFAIRKIYIIGYATLILQFVNPIFGGILIMVIVVNIYFLLFMRKFTLKVKLNMIHLNMMFVYLKMIIGTYINSIHSNLNVGRETLVNCSVRRLLFINPFAIKVRYLICIINTLYDLLMVLVIELLELFSFLLFLRLIFINVSFLHGVRLQIMLLLN